MANAEVVLATRVSLFSLIFKWEVSMLLSTWMLLQVVVDVVMMLMPYGQPSRRLIPMISSHVGGFRPAATMCFAISAKHHAIMPLLSAVVSRAPAARCGVLVGKLVLLCGLCKLCNLSACWGLAPSTAGDRVPAPHPTTSNTELIATSDNPGIHAMNACEAHPGLHNEVSCQGLLESVGPVDVASKFILRVSLKDTHCFCLITAAESLPYAETASDLCD